MVFVSAFALAGAVGCGSGKGGGGGGAPGDMDGGGSTIGDDAGPLDDAPDTLGTLSAKLQVAMGVTVSNLTWTISNPTLLSADRTGSVDVSNSQDIQFVVGGLPAGSGYTITIAGMAEPGGMMCSGTAMFSIQQNETTAVDITLVCLSKEDAGDTGSVMVGCGTAIGPLCAAVTSLSASPSAVDIGGVVNLSATGIDAMGNTADVTLSWAVTGGAGGGTFGSPTGGSTTFTCTKAGPVTVTVTATTSPDASGCQGNTASVPITCEKNVVTAIVVSPHEHACALFADGTAQCWGANDLGQLGIGMMVGSSLSPAPVANLHNAKSLVAGNTHTCALLTDSTVQCWGELAMLGTGQSTGMDNCGFPCSLKPVQVPGLSGVTALAAGSTHTCALLSGGTVQCWGDNLSGELGDGTMNNALSPVAVAGLTGVKAISAGDSDTCALLSGGTVQCWGYNPSGQLGSGATGPDNCSGYPCSLKPVSVKGLSGVAAIVSGGSHSCALLSDRTVQCWGFNDVGELGNGSVATAMAPVAVSNLGNVLALGSGVYHSCAVVAGGTVQCWGDNSKGQFCNGTTTNATKPVAVSNLGGATVVSAGDYDTCALLPGNQVACCGINAKGQLGNGTVSNSPIPVPIGL
jgi:alpha-tubulin suppressor-like RCC1 family protein